jgi:hypothetical protein
LQLPSANKPYRQAGNIPILKPTFEQYLIRRGYDLRLGAQPFFRRMFLSCWAEPGFHRFWRVWNPLYGYFLFKLYRVLGGNKRKVLATLSTFIFCGFFLHDLPVSLIADRLLMNTTSAFMFFGVFAILNHQLEKRLKQRYWPRMFNVALNIGLIGMGFVLSALLQRYV